MWQRDDGESGITQISRLVEKQSVFLSEGKNLPRP